ncbi:MAG TPA: hypothetical protein VFZ36_12600, partial [Vicinamibacterales bacterium]
MEAAPNARAAPSLQAESREPRAVSERSEDLPNRREPAQVHQLQQRHLEVIARLRRAAYLELGAREDVERAHQIL